MRNLLTGLLPTVNSTLLIKLQLKYLVVKLYLLSHRFTKLHLNTLTERCTVVQKLK